MLPSLNNKESAGGLGVAIEESLKRNGGVWFGWSGEISNEKKIERLKSIAKKTVDVKGIGFYTLGKYRKNLTDDQKKKYSELFEKYFLKSFIILKTIVVF